MKRFFDLFIIILTMPIVLSVTLMIALSVRYKLGSPVLFRQLRPGYNEKIFSMVKFRTMANICDENNIPLPDLERITVFGSFLRSTSLDELPSLWNVFKGEMTLVGPRPLLVEYLELYTPQQARRHSVKPGLTGWAQVNGRNDLSWKEKFELDIWYVENQSILLDIKILLMSIKKVLFRDGILKKGEITTSKFKGAK